MDSNKLSEIETLKKILLLDGMCTSDSKCPVECFYREEIDEGKVCNFKPIDLQEKSIGMVPYTIKKAEYRVFALGYRQVHINGILELVNEPVTLTELREKVKCFNGL